MEEALAQLLPRILGSRATWAINNYRNKDNLLRKLPDRLRGYASRLNGEPHLRIVVLVDQDSEPCAELKQRLEGMARQAGLLTKSMTTTPTDFTILNRIVVTELESWLLGDVPALCECYPRLPRTLDRRRGMRSPDAISNAWETLHRQLRQVGELGEVYPKIEVARSVAARLDPARNRSRSFQHFCAGLETMLV